MIVRFFEGHDERPHKGYLVIQFGQRDGKGYLVIQFGQRDGKGYLEIFFVSHVYTPCLPRKIKRANGVQKTNETQKTNEIHVNRNSTNTKPLCNV